MILSATWATVGGAAGFTAGPALLAGALADVAGGVASGDLMSRAIAKNLAAMGIGIGSP